MQKWFQFMSLLIFGLFLMGTASATPEPETTETPFNPCIALTTGIPFYRPEDPAVALDEGTIVDLELLETVPSVYLPHLPSILGVERLANALTHPLTSVKDIESVQNAVRAIAEDSDLMAKLDLFFKRPQPKDSLVKHLVDKANKETPSRSEANMALTLLPIVPAIFALVGYQALYSPVSAAHGLGLWEKVVFVTKFASGSAGLTEMLVLLVKGKVGLGNVPAAARAMSGYRKGMLEIQDSLLASSSERLREIGTLFTAAKDPDHRLQVMRGLKWASYDPGIWRQLLHYFTHFDVFRSEHAKRSLIKHKEAISELLSGVADLEMLYAFAKVYQSSNGQYTFPAAVESHTPFIHILGGHHPDIHFQKPEESVANSVSLGKNPTGADGAEVYLMTGPNGRGKSTFVKMIGSLTAMAMAGSPVPAQSMSFTPVPILTNIKDKPSVAGGLSSFQLQLTRLAEIGGFLKKYENRGLFILDEILTGTDYQHHHASEKGVLKFILDRANLIGILSTHDRALSSFGDIQNLQAFSEKSSRRFQVGPGVSNDYNAFDEMEKFQVDPEIIANSRMFYEEDEIKPAQMP